MKAMLDHVGIAVERLDEALAFYRDALGLEVDVPEDVPTQKVRAHMLETGAAALEPVLADGDPSVRAIADGDALVLCTETLAPGEVYEIAGVWRSLQARAR